MSGEGLREFPLFAGTSGMEPRGFEPPTSAVQRRRDTLLELSDVCKIPANKRISTLSPFLGFQDIYSGCCTVAAQTSTCSYNARSEELPQPYLCPQTGSSVSTPSIMLFRKSRYILKMD